MARLRARFGRRGVLGWTGLSAMAGVGAVGLVQCAGENPAGAQPLGLTSRGGWAFPQPNPIIKAGDMRSQGLWNDPCVLHDGTSYVMYMTSSTAAPFKPPDRKSVV